MWYLHKNQKVQFKYEIRKKNSYYIKNEWIQIYVINNQTIRYNNILYIITSIKSKNG